MSWSERLVRDQRRQTDCAIHRAYIRLAQHQPELEKFHQLLQVVRQRTPRLFDAPVCNGHHLGVEALVHLSRYRNWHIRPISDWEGTNASWRPVVSMLADRLICRYKLPVFLSSSWYAIDSMAERKRNWFVAYSRGGSFRSLNLPMVMTRKMEHIFLASQDHLHIEHGFRRAELIALGAPAEVVNAILSTRLATDLSHGEFWRTVWVFLVQNCRDIDPAQIGPMIDFIHAVRHERIRVETADGIRKLDPLQPLFSMKGRTVQSMLRLMNEWHRSLGKGGPAFFWKGLPVSPLVLDETNEDGLGVPRRWQMVELTSSSQLRSEGAALHHCVASYADRCRRGASSIWSLRFWRGEKLHHVLTVEVDPNRRAIIQARGRANRPASGKPLQLLQDWALKERLRMAI